MPFSYQNTHVLRLLQRSRKETPSPKTTPTPQTLNPKPFLLNSKTRSTTTYPRALSQTSSRSLWVTLSILERKIFTELPCLKADRGGALIIRIGFGGILYYNKYDKELLGVNYTITIIRNSLNYFNIDNFLRPLCLTYTFRKSTFGGRATDFGVKGLAVGLTPKTTKL